MASLSKKVLAAVTLIVIAVFFVFMLGREKPLDPLPASATRIVVVKHAHTMSLFHDDRLLKTYDVALGRGGMAPKSRAGDNLVPEGNYTIVSRNPHSAFHKALHVGYPTEAQLRSARASGVDPGDDIMIHGIRNGLGWLGPLQRKVDWTKGCIAVTDKEMDQIWTSVPDGTPIMIQP